MSLTGGLIVLEQLKQSGELCGLLKHLGLVQNCPLPTLPEAVQHALDKKIMCEIYHCCKDPKTNPRPNGEQYSKCVQDVIDQADAFIGRRGHFKAEVSFKRDGTPWMYGQSNTPRRPTGAFPRFPAGSSRPDVVTVKDPTRQPTPNKIFAVQDPTMPQLPGNIDRIYEFKFPGNRWSEGQQLRYEDLAGAGNVVEISDETCPDEEGKKQGVLATASAFSLAKDNAAAAQVNKATAAIVLGASVPGRAAAISKWVGEAFREALVALGFIAGAAQ